MNKYFIYYSASGNGDFLASLLESKGYKPIKIEMVKPIKRINFFSIMRYGGEAMMKKKAKIVEPNLVIEEEDVVIIGSPIWNGRISSPVNMALSMLKQNGLSSKKVSFIFYAGSGEGKKALKRVNKEFPEAEVFFLKEPKKYPEELEKLGKRLSE